MTDDIDLSQYRPGGPIERCYEFVVAVFEQERYDAAWQLMDPNLRLCRAQAWLWNNRTHPSVAGRLDELAQAWVRGDVDDSVWENFGAIELRQLREAWRRYYEGQLGAASHPRPFGPDLEIIILAPTHGEVLRFDGPTLIDALKFVMRLVESDWMVAGYGEFVPEPGWPPALQPR